MKTLLLIFSLATISFVACKKNNTGESQDFGIADATKTYKDIASIIISTAKTNDNFRTIAYSECNKQQYGDYYVKLNELIALNATHNYWDATTVAKLSDLERELSETKRNNVTIFIPSIEKHPEKVTQIRNQSRTGAYEEPVAVIATEYDNPTQTSPGYIVESNGVLTFYQTINETFAWEHDVWVVGEEENCSPENMVAAVEDTAILTYGRVNGGAEYGGIIKVTNWSLVEPWVAGKVEFRSIVFKGAGGGGSVHDKPYGKWRRQNFDGVFKDFGTFLFNWNISNIGDWTTEKWIEEDGGTSNAISSSVSWKDAFGITHTTTITSPAKDRDDDLGLTIIQFSDNINQEYDLGGVKIKRRN